MKKCSFFIVILFNAIFLVYNHAENLCDIFPKRDVKMVSMGSNTDGFMKTINGVSVPSDFPDIEVQQFGKTAPGKIFFSSTFGNLGNYLIILNNDGTPYFFEDIRDIPVSGMAAVQISECSPQVC